MKSYCCIDQAKKNDVFDQHQLPISDFFVDYASKGKQAEVKPTPCQIRVNNDRKPTIGIADCDRASEKGKLWKIR